MRKLIIATFAAATLAGCQTRITWNKNPEVLKPVYKEAVIGGTNALYISSYERASGGYEVTARSPLWADEALKGLNLSVGKDGEITFGLEEYRRDLSTNAVVMTHNLVTDFALLAEKAAAAYATAGTSILAAKAQSAVQKSIASYILKGGNATNTTVSCANGLCTFSDGTVTESCPSGNCNP